MIEDCQGIRNVGVYRQNGDPNWRLSGIINFGDECDRNSVSNALPLIVKNLQEKFNLI